MKIEDFILLIKSSEVNAHFYHLASNYYSAHKALENYYETIRPLVDKLTECSQGKFGTKYNFTRKTIVISELSPENYFNNLYIQANTMIEQLFSEDEDLENIAYEILDEIHQVSYLLTLQ